MTTDKKISGMGEYDVVIIDSGTSGQTAVFNLNEKGSLR